MQEKLDERELVSFKEMMMAIRKLKDSLNEAYAAEDRLKKLLKQSGLIS